MIFRRLTTQNSVHGHAETARANAPADRLRERGVRDDRRGGPPDGQRIDELRGEVLEREAEQPHEPDDRQGPQVHRHVHRGGASPPPAELPPQAPGRFVLLLLGGDNGAAIQQPSLNKRQTIVGRRLVRGHHIVQTSAKKYAFELSKWQTT